MDVNILNNKELLSQISKYFIRQKVKNIMKEQQNNNDLIEELDKDEFFKELDQEEAQNKIKQPSKSYINFGLAANVGHQKTIKVEQYLGAKGLIKKANEPIALRYQSLPNIEVESLNYNSNQLSSNYEEKSFFRKIDQSIQKLEEKMFKKQLEREKIQMEVEEQQVVQDEKVEKFAKLYNIDLQNLKDENLSSNWLYKEFLKRSMNVISKTVEEAKKKNKEFLAASEREARLRKKNKVIRLSSLFEKKLKKWKYEKWPSSLGWIKNISKKQKNSQTNSVDNFESCKFIKLDGNLNEQFEINQQDLLEKQKFLQEENKQNLRELHNKMNVINQQCIEDEFEKKNESEFIIEGLKNLEQAMDDLQGRAEFQTQLKQLDFGTDGIIQQKIKRDMGALKRLEKKQHVRAMRIMKYQD